MFFKYTKCKKNNNTTLKIHIYLTKLVRANFDPHIIRFFPHKSTLQVFNVFSSRNPNKIFMLIKLFQFFSSSKKASRGGTQTAPSTYLHRKKKHKGSYRSLWRLVMQSYLAPGWAIHHCGYSCVVRQFPIRLYRIQ